MQLRSDTELVAAERGAAVRAGPGCHGAGSRMPAPAAAAKGPARCLPGRVLAGPFQLAFGPPVT